MCQGDWLLVPCMDNDSATIFIIYESFLQAAEGERAAAEKATELLQKQTAEGVEEAAPDEPQKHMLGEEEPRMAMGAMHVPRETGEASKARGDQSWST